MTMSSSPMSEIVSGPYNNNKMFTDLFLNFSHGHEDRERDGFDLYLVCITRMPGNGYSG